MVKRKLLILVSVFAVLSLAGAFIYFILVKPRELADIINLTNFTNLTTSSTPEYRTTENGIQTAPNEQPLKMLFFGDLMLDRHVKEVIDRKGFDYIFAQTASGTGVVWDNGYDLVGANLEGAVTDGGAHYPPVNAYDFAFMPELVDKLKRYNFNFFNIANNHLADQGERGIMETEANLSGLGYIYSGCPDTRIGDCSATTTELKGTKIGLAGFSQVYGLLDTVKLNKITGDLASTTDILIANIHWGREYEHQFGSVQAATAHTLVDSGADIVIGHHPHVVEGIEIYRGRPIFYSLGNFVFDQYFSADTQSGLALDFSITKNQISVTLLPFKSTQSQLEWLAGEEKQEFLNQLAVWSVAGSDLKSMIKSGRIDTVYGDQ